MRDEEKEGGKRVSEKQERDRWVECERMRKWLLSNKQLVTVSQYHSHSNMFCDQIKNNPAPITGGEITTQSWKNPKNI